MTVGTACAHKVYCVTVGTACAQAVLYICSYVHGKCIFHVITVVITVYYTLKLLYDLHGVCISGRAVHLFVIKCSTATLHSDAFEDTATKCR